jgi:tetratricopeptide (TPR) repeat protein
VTADTSPELTKLVELSAKYPEIGPPLAELAFKIGRPEVAKRIMRMGLGQDSPGLEYYFVAAHAARRENRHEDALRLAIDAVRAFAAAPDSAIVGDDRQRLLHLVRLGFATLMFDVKDVNSHPWFPRDLAAELAKAEARLANDPFYRSLLAQALWFEDRGRSEAEWDRADELGEPELTWNARGTWYREAERDIEKAASAYRKGLEKAPSSPLLRHNLAQVLVDQARAAGDDQDKARRLLHEADGLLREALREQGPKGLRRHIHATRDRLHELRSTLAPREKGRRDRGGASQGGAEAAPRSKEKPTVGEKLVGRVRSLAPYGVFVALPGGYVGLLHKSELAVEQVEDPATVVAAGDEIEVQVLEVGNEESSDRLRIRLSRRVLLPGGDTPRPQPAGEEGRGRPRGPRNGQGRGRGPGHGGGQARGEGRSEGRGEARGEARGESRGEGRGRGRGPRRGPREDRQGDDRRDDDRRPARDRDDDRRPPRERDDARRSSSAQDKAKQEKLASLGEMLLAKLSDDESKS